MELILNKNKRSGAIGAVLVHLLLLILFLLLGMTHQEPPEDLGTELYLNFGNNTNGADAGMVQKGEPESSPSAAANPTTASSALSQTEQLVAEQGPVAVDQGKAVEEATQPTAERPVNDPVERVEPTISEEELKRIQEEERQKAFQDRLGNPFANAGNAESEGTSTGPGDAGRLDGNAAHGDAYDIGNTPGSGGLAGRNTSFVPSWSYKGQEEGTVVVQVIVDQNGKVVRATPGVNWKNLRTTNASPDLLAEARKIALQYRWDPNPNAPPQQVGYIPVAFIKGK